MSSRLSAYARQFLDQMQKPDVDFIEGLSPAIAIEQRSSGSQPALHHRHHHGDLRLPAAALRARRPAALPGNRRAHRRARPPAISWTKSSRCRRKTRVMLLAPVVRRQKGEFRDVIERLAREGFVRARVDGELVELANGVRVKLDKKKSHHRGGGGPAGD